MKKLILLGAIIGLFASCGSTKSLYSWYNYEDATYQYNKKRTDELKVKMMDQYLKLIQKQKGSRKLFLQDFMQNMGTLFTWAERKKKV